MGIIKNLLNKLIKKDQKEDLGNIPENLYKILKREVKENGGTIFPGRGMYEYCWYEEKGHKFIFYPHTSSNGHKSIRIRVANPMIVSVEKTKILKRLISLGFHCKSLPKNWE